MRDYHVHTRFCRHAVGEAEEYARAALEQGLKEICFTPHIPLPAFRPGFFGDKLRMDLEEFEPYLKAVEKLKSRFPELSILTGIEADYYEGLEGFLEDFLSHYPFDLVLMSVHFVREWPENEWVFDFDRSGKPLSRIYREYFRALRRGILTGLFDGVAHLDLIKQPGQPVLRSNREEVEEILELCLKQGMSVEINTSGFRKKIAEPYPCLDVILLMLERKVPVTLGSDAHAPSQVGLYFDEIKGRLNGCLEPLLVRYRERRMAPLRA